jgi:hypothetical protein
LPSTTSKAFGYNRSSGVQPRRLREARSSILAEMPPSPVEVSFGNALPNSVQIHRPKAHLIVTGSVGAARRELPEDRSAFTGSPMYLLF